MDMIDVTTLATSEPEALAHLAEGIITPGVTAFYGRNKTGKSRIALQLAACVTQGKTFLGDIPTTRCGVLYLCLSDTPARMRKRLGQLTDTPPDNLYFVYTCEKIRKGLEERLVQTLKAHPDIGLVIIDPFSKIRTDDNTYNRNFDDISILKDVADAANISLLLIDNLRKHQDKCDPYNEIYGINGVVDAADTVIRLEKERRDSHDAWLFVTGRDVEDQTLLIRREGNIWQLVSREAKIEEDSTPPFLHRLIAFMSGRIHWEGTATELLEAMGETTVPANYVTRYIKTYAKTILEPEGIHFYTARTSKARKLVLDRRETHEPTPCPEMTA